MRSTVWLFTCAALPDLTAVSITPGDRFVEALEREWSRGAAVAPVDERLPAAEQRLLLDALRPTHVIEADGERRSVSGGRPVDRGDAVVIATSGTTGRPKGVVLTHEALLASAEMTSGHLGVDPASDRWLCCLPISHIGGLSVITRALLTGTPVSVHDRFDPDDVMKSVREDGVTRTSLVTRALRRIDARPFTSILLGGAAPPADRPANVIATYGSTETGSGVVYDRRPLEGVELRIDRSGQLWVRSPTLLRCYRDGVDPKDPDGWFPTGDAAVIGADGDLVVAGRAAEVIVTGGEKVWPSRIEPLIAALSSVAGVAVIGRPHPEWGHEVVAVVEPADPSAPPTIDEIKEVVRSVLPPRWAPRRVELVRSLPRTPLGKIRRDAL